MDWTSEQIAEIAQRYRDEEALQLCAIKDAYSNGIVG